MIESSVHPTEPVPLPMRPFGTVVRSVLGYGAVTGLMLAANDLAIFIPAVLIHCALRNGRRAAWGALAVALPLAAAAIAGLPESALPFVIARTAATALAIAVPAIFAVPLVERNEHFGRVLMFLGGGAAIGFGITELAARAFANYSPYAAHVKLMQTAVAQMVQMYRAGGGQEADRLGEWMSYYATSLQPAALLLSAVTAFVLSLLMIGRLRAWRERMTGETAANHYRFRNFAMPDWVLFAFVFGGITPLVTGALQQLAANVLMVVTFLYVLQGFALLRFLLAAVGIGFLGALIACAFTMLTGIGPLLLGVAGLFDPFFDFRHSKKRKDDSHESHSD
jgi:uncharacterized protein YybS (DUF2232 family)